MKPWTAEELQHHLLAMSEGSTEHHVLRRRILDVASEHFTRFGYRRANVGDMARDVGIGKGTIYLHFDSKRTLLIAAVAREKLALVKPFGAMFELPELEQLEAYVLLTLRFSLTSPLISKLMRGDPELERIMGDIMRDNPESTEQGLVIIETVMRPHVPDLDAPALRLRALSLRAALLSVVHLVDTPHMQQLSVEAFTQTYARMLVSGVAG